ncbi:MAG TPA: CpaF family protein [Alphaproteobacteria bacterium]|jgi:pilus assembly protein CpaF
MKPPVFGRRSAKSEGSVTPFPTLARAETSASATGEPVAETADSAELRRLKVQSIFLQQVNLAVLARLPRQSLTAQVGTLVDEILAERRLVLEANEKRDLVAHLVDGISNPHGLRAVPPEPAKPSDDEAGRLALPAPSPRTPAASAERENLESAKARIQAILLERIDVTAAAHMPRKEISRQISNIVVEILGELKLQLNLIEQRDLVTMLIHDMLGLGPLEPLLADESITDIMVNGPKQVYVERRGKLELTDVTFRNDAHVMNIATRIVTRIGRRIDETTPLVDARLEDGSRVNIIGPPLAIDGPSISIRKFSKKSITLDVMSRQRNMSEEISKALKIASRCRLNLLISGGTGSGKTTLLNAMSQLIDHGERIVTIEDAAELQLQQPHVVRLETRPANLEGSGEIGMRDLLKNALRMRPDRIILGEVRGAEALDMLQAMNTGHDGSMCTLHANNPREALTRLENMVAMAGVNLPSHAVRTQIASAVHMIVQISRMRDGVRRITNVTEVVGMEGDVITTQPLFQYEFQGETSEGLLMGAFKPSGLRPHFTQKAEYYGLGRTLIEAVAGGSAEPVV